MFFSSLSLIGFKSFKREKFIFKAPISLFTGPNGCGKTNIIDAIRWTMGEQNLNLLRVKSMQELIFHGSDKQKPMKMAEVSISLNNNNRILPLPSHEIKITRRVSLKGESTYLINEKPCRKKDITSLLLDTGLSEDSYFLMNREKIDTILKSNEERLRLFEEASGITGYKVKKEEALGNLRKSMENIVRIQDIMGELKRQRDSLKSQVRKAKRYKRLSDELNVYRYHSLSREYNIKSEALKKAKIEIERIKREILDNKKINEEKMEAFKALKDSLKEKENKLFKVREEKEKIREKIARDEERLINIMNAISSLKEREEMLLKKEKSLKDELLSIEAEKKNLLEMKEKDPHFPSLSIEIGSTIKEMLKEEEKVKGELIDELSKKAEINGRLNEAKREISNIILKIERLTKENTRQNREKGEISLKREKIEKEKQIIKENIEGEKNVISELNKRETEILNKEMNIKKEGEFAKAREGLVGKTLYGILVKNEEIAGLISYIKQLNLKIFLLLKISGEGATLFNLVILKDKEDALRLSKDGWKMVEIDGQRTEGKGEENGFSNRLKEIEEIKRAIIRRKKECEERLLTYENTFEKVSQEALREKEEEEALTLRIERNNDEIILCKAQEREHQKEVEDFTLKEKELREKIMILEKRFSVIKTEINNLKDKEKKIEDEKREIITRNALQRERLSFLKKQEKKQKEQITNLIYEREAIVKEKERKEKEYIILKESLKDTNKTLDVILKEELEIEKEKSALSLSIMEEERIYLKQEEKINSLYKTFNEHNENIKELEISLSLLNEKIEAKKGEYGEKIKEMKIKMDKEKEGKIEKELLKYGEIDLSSISEYDKIEERITFYERELCDLHKAKDDMLSVINELDKRAKELFNETFEKIRGNFSSIFSNVLEGGSGDIILDNGRIEIEAQMPGKKKKGLSLLSSGERTLLAIILLFSLFIIKPAPFCFLDEVDTSLDDANIKRFIDLIKWFSKDVQFLVISHNKKMIEIGDIIYGITMETPGVSKSLSLRLKK